MTPLDFARQARWRVAAFLAVAAALNYADRAAMSAVLAAVRTEFAVSDVQLGLLGSLFLWSYALGSPLAGSLADRFSRTKIVFGSLAAWSAVTALMGLASGFPMLLALRFSLGVAECLFLPAAVALIADYHPASTRARAMSFITIGINCGMVVGGGFTGYMAEHHGWRSGFWILGVGGIILAWVGTRMMPPALKPVGSETGAKAKRGSFVAAIKYLARAPSYYALLLESMLSGFGMWVFFTWLPLYFRDTYHMTLAGAGFAGTFMLQVAVMLGIFVGGIISDRVAGHAPQRRMMLYGIFYLAAAPFLLLFLGRPEFPVVAVGIAAFSFLRGLGQANDNPTQCEVVPSQFRATGIGIMNCVSTAAGGCGVLVVGFLKGTLGLEAIFAAISGIFLVAGTVLLIGYRYFMPRDIVRAQAMEQPVLG
ncbi:MAG: MFS transporter [Verrucomicrobiota bacterium]